MLTPRFEITQTDTEIIITVHAPYANIKDTEVYVDKADFRFYSNPYYLRLQLPGEIEENDKSFGSYHCEKGNFTLRFSKVNEGEHFENLSMVTTLLAPPKRKSTIVSPIEVIGNPSANSADIDESLNDNDTTVGADSGDNWFIPQNNPVQNIILLSDSPKYGFANKISGALTAFEAAWIKEIIDLPFPDTTPETERKALREKRELEDFNEEHYMGDFMQDECIKPYMTYIAEWDTLQKDEIAFNEAEIDLLKELPNKEYLLEVKDIRKLHLNLVDILYASCYNHRTTLGENTVESCWTINKLSSTLSWFQGFTSMDEVITACFRRSLCYPLFRNWELSKEVLEDVKKVVKLGRKYVIKRFCEIHNLFNNSYEPRYILNQLYVKDYLIWLQTSPETWIESLKTVLDDVHPNKESIGLELVEIEAAACSVQEEGLVIENTIHKMVEQIDGLFLNDIEKEKLSGHSSLIDSSDTDSESDSESSTTSSSTTTSSSNSLDSDDLSKSE